MVDKSGEMHMLNNMIKNKRQAMGGHHDQERTRHNIDRRDHENTIVEFKNPETGRERFWRELKESGDLDEDDDCVDKFMSCSQYLAAIIICLFFLIAPGVMLYAGIKTQNCDDIFTVWLILGGILCYAVAILGACIYAMRSQAPSCIQITFLGLSVITIIWWVFGFGRVFAPARSYMKNPSSWESGSKGIYGESWMKEADCKRFLFDFPFWLTLCPFMLMGLFFLFIFILGFLHCIGCDD